MGYRSIISLMPKTAPVDPDAQAFLTAAVITDPTISGAINTLVVQMKADGIWSKMKAIYPMVGGTANTHKFNLKDPRDLDDAFRLTYYGGWTHSANGALPNGTNGYAFTHLIPFTHLDVNSTHISIYCTNNPSASACIDLGCGNLSTNGLLLSAKYNSGVNETLIYNYFSASQSFVNTDTRGFLITNRQSSGSLKCLKNGSQIGTTTGFNGTNLPDLKISLAGYNGNNNISSFSLREYAFASIGTGLSDTESANFYTAVQKFQTTLNRQV